MKFVVKICTFVLVNSTNISNKWSGKPLLIDLNCSGSRHIQSLSNFELGTDKSGLNGYFISWN